MVYLIAQTWLFLILAMLVGTLMGIAMMWTRKTERHLEVEAELRDVRNRGFTLEKDLGEAHERIGELEGLSPGERVARIGARENMMTQIETGVLEDQVVDFLLARAKTSDQPLTFQQFMGA